MGALLIAGYLTYTHFQPQALMCSTSGVIDCGAVTTSPQSIVLGVPVAMLGLAGYLVITVMNSPWAWRSSHRSVHVVRLIALTTSMAFVLWLIAAELLIIGHICEWCSGVHLITFVVFITVVRVTPDLLNQSALRTPAYQELGARGTGIATRKATEDPQ